MLGQQGPLSMEITNALPGLFSFSGTSPTWVIHTDVNSVERRLLR